MSYHMEEILVKKRPVEECVSTELSDEDIMENFKDDLEFAQLLVDAKNHLQKNEIPTAAEEQEQTSVSASTTENLPNWKTELQQKVASVKTIEELDLLTREFVKKNRPRKLPKKKLVRVENFYLRHTSGLQWMNNFIGRTKTDAISRPYVERMLELEYQFKKTIEQDELLGPQLIKEE